MYLTYSYLILGDRIFDAERPFIFSNRTVYFQRFRTVYFRRPYILSWGPYIFSSRTVYFQPGPYILRVTRRILWNLNMTLSDESNMTRVILEPNDLLTSFDLRTQTFRVGVELAFYYRRQTRKKNSSRKVTFGHFFKNFFSKSVAKMDIKRLHWDQWWPILYPKNFFEPKGYFLTFFQTFFSEFSDQEGCQAVSFWPLMT